MAQIKVVSGGANGSPGSLLISGNLSTGSARPFAGAMFFPGTTAFAPANLSSKRGISFWAKGDGRTYSVMMFAINLGRIPTSVPFTAGAAWKQYSFPFSSFRGLDPSQLEGVLFSAAGAPGKFALQIDEVKFE